MVDKLYSDLNKGAWSAIVAYTVGDFVDVNGSSYVCIANNTNQTPPNATYWALIASKGDKGDAGDEIELQKTATHIQWRYTDGEWSNLVALSDLVGPIGPDGEQGIQGIQGVAGKEVEIQVSGGYIQWKYDSDESWTNLIEVATLVGPQGDDGTDGVDGANSYVYIAYASDDSGTDFTLTFDSELNYVAIKHTTTAIASPIVSDFTGLWKNYKGPTGATGPAGEGSGDVLGPATNNDNYLPQWNGANSKTLKNGVPIPSGGLAGLTALGDKVDKITGKGLSTEDYTSIEKTAVGTIGDKADKTNVLEKTNVTSFTPTADYHPSTKKYVDDQVATAVVGLLDYRGSYDASTNLYPATGGSGIAGAILKGDFWRCSVAGTLDGKPVTIGDLIICLNDTPGQTASNWDVVESDLGFIPEDVANKSTNTSLGTSDTLYPSQKAVKDYVDNHTPNLGTIINAATEKTTPVDADMVGLMDSEHTNLLYKLSWANIKATIKAYYDAVTATLTNKTLTSPKLNEDVALTATSTELNNLHSKTLNLGAWTSFTPSWTNLTVGSGTNVGYYCQIGKTILYRISLTFAANTSVSSFIYCAFPVTTNLTSPYIQYGRVTFYDTSSDVFNFGIHWGDNEVSTLNAASTYLLKAGANATVPFTFATGDIITIEGEYEAA